MAKTIRLLLLLSLLITAAIATTAHAATHTIDVLTVKGAINPVVADYIERGIYKETCRKEA